MTLKLISGPAAEPVTLVEAKAHLRIETSDDNTLIDSLIKAARAHIDGADGWLGRALMYQTYDLSVDNLCIPIRLPLPPLVSVTSVKYLDTAGDEQTLAASLYRVVDRGSWPSFIEPDANAVWPATLGVSAAVTVRFICARHAANDCALV